MWIVAKVDKKNLFNLKKEFSFKLGEGLQIYSPKILLEKFAKKKLIKKEIEILGDYIFCFHNKFESSNSIVSLKYTKGLKYFLPRSEFSQEEIKNFILKCKNNENSKGYLRQSFFNIYINRQYKFNNGPFADKIFNIINIQKNKINILLENIKTKIDKNKFIFKPV